MNYGRFEALIYAGWGAATLAMAPLASSGQ